ncbi:unnamed protein product [Heterobilharzia americana]|nr:unnamed protein product [Heterobilharzia americana]
MEETIFGPSSFDVFPQPTSSKCCETQFGRKPKRLSVREIKIRRSEDCNTYAALTRHLRAKARWNTAFSLISSCGDPWEKFHLQELPEETAKRYRYHAIKANGLKILYM